MSNETNSTYPMPRSNPLQWIVWVLAGMTVITLIALAAAHSSSHSNLAPGQVEIALLVPGGDRAQGTYDALIPAFEKANPGIKVKRYDIPDQGWFVKLQIMIAAGSAPDVVPMMSMRLPQFLEHNAFLPLDDFMAADADFQKFKDDIYPRTFEGFRKDGKLYGFATSQDSYILYYNKTIFDKYNQGVPPNQRITYPNGTWTLDYYLDVCKKLTRSTNGDGRIDQWGTITQDVPVYIICPILRRFGADLFNADKTRCTLDDPKAIEAMQWYFDLALKDGVAPSPAGADARSAGTVAGTPADVFAAGKIAMFEAEGGWRYQFARDVKSFEWDVAEPPVGVVQTNGWECDALSITRSSQHPQEAWKFISFILSPQGQKILLDNQAGMPVLKSLCTSKEGFLDPNTLPLHKELFLKTMTYGKDIPGLKNFEEVEAAIMTELQWGMLGKKSAADACKAAAKEANRLLAENRDE